MLALAAIRPHDDSWSPDAIGAACTAAAVVVILLAIIVHGYLKDRRQYGGVGSFKRRRVLRSGITANATVLSSRRIEEDKSGIELPTGVPIGPNRLPPMAFYSN